MHTSLLTDQFIFHLSAYKRFMNAYVAAYVDVSLEADFRQHTRSCWIDCTRGEGGECFIHDSPHS